MIESTGISVQALRGASALAAALVGLLFFVAIADAQSYSIKSCDASTTNHASFGEEWEGIGHGSGIHPINDCPNGIRLDMRDVAAQGARTSTFFHILSQSVAKSVKFKYYGGDTSGEYEYTARSCASGCDALKILTPGASSAVPTTVTITLPPVGPLEPDQGDPSVAIQAECIAVICADPPEFVVKNFNFEFDDSVDPDVTNIVTDPANTLGPTGETLDLEDIGEVSGPGEPVVADVAGPRWIRGNSFKLSYDVTDLESGVEQTSVGFDLFDATPTLPYDPCAETRGARRCDASVDVATKIDISDLNDGQHRLYISASDASIDEVGIPNFSVKRYPFLLDNGPPGEPTGLALSENVSQRGWTAEPEVAVSHDDALLDPKNTEFSGFNATTVDLRSSPNSDPIDPVNESGPSEPATIQIPHEGQWDVGLTYRDNAGNSGNRAHLPVGFDADSPERPDPVPLDWISLEELHEGINQTWVAPPADADLESGICAYAFAVDDEQLGIPEPTADVLAPKTFALIPSGIGEGNHYAHVRTIACNNKASLTETVPVNVDGTPPVPVLHGHISADWLTSAPNLSLSATDALSGVAALEYGFDGVGSLNLIPGSSTPITVPQGAQTITYRAIDVAGNASVPVEKQINADWTPPTAEFLPRDPTRPSVLTARVDDAHSGVAGLGMQRRRTDSNASPSETGWKSLGAFDTLDDAGAKSRTISRQIPDGELADGTYEVRVTARDVAGNWSDSAPALQLTLPIRSKPALSAAIARVGKGSKINWSGASQDRVLTYGTSSALVGSLLDADRNPIANAPINVTAIAQFSVPDQPKQLTTDAKGEFALRLPRGPTRRFEIEYEGNDRFQSTEQTADIRVRAALDFRASPSSVRSDRPFRLSGRLLSGSLGLPEGGKVLSIQFRRKNKWVPTIATPRVDSKGRFSVKWDGVEARRPTTVYFRVRALREGTWPFLSGSSKAVALRIRP